MNYRERLIEELKKYNIEDPEDHADLIFFIATQQEQGVTMTLEQFSRIMEVTCKVMERAADMMEAELEDG